MQYTESLRRTRFKNALSMLTRWRLLQLDFHLLTSASKAARRRDERLRHAEAVARLERKFGVEMERLRQEERAREEVFRALEAANARRTVRDMFLSNEDLGI